MFGEGIPLLHLRKFGEWIPLLHLRKFGEGIPLLRLRNHLIHVGGESFPRLLSPIPFSDPLLRRPAGGCCSGKGFPSYICASSGKGFPSYIICATAYDHLLGCGQPELLFPFGEKPSLQSRDRGGEGLADRLTMEGVCFQIGDPFFVPWAYLFVCPSLRVN